MSRPRRTRIKICGITSVEMAKVAIDAGADYIGLVFAVGSPRFIEDFAVAADIIDMLAPHRPAAPDVKPVGVFRDPVGGRPDNTLEGWLRLAEWCQFHGTGDESTLPPLGPEHRIIRGLPFDAEHVRHCDRLDGVEALLIEGPASGKGRSFDHRPLAAMMDDITKPVFLAGGLTPENVGEAITKVRPYAVDVSSGVESSPGVKDPGLIRAFCDAVGAADAALDDR